MSPPKNPVQWEVPPAEVLTRRLEVPFYPVTNNDRLRIRVVTAQSSARTHLKARILTTIGEVVEVEHVLRWTTAQAIYEDQVYLTNGWLLSATAGSGGIGITAGNVFAEISLMTGHPDEVTPTAVLAAGYLTTERAIAWPGQIPIDPRSKQIRYGLLSTVTVAAGTEFTFTPPAFSVWSDIMVYGRLTTSAVAGNRIPTLSIRQGGSELYRVMSEQVLGASDNRIFQFAFIGRPDYSGGTPGFGFINMPQLRLLTSANSIVSVTQNLDAADQWDLLTLSGVEGLRLE